MNKYEFVFCVPTRLVYGRGKLNEIGLYTLSLGLRKVAVITTAGGSMRRYGYIDRLISSLESRGIASVVLDKVYTNPTTDLVDELVAVVKDEEPDGIIAIGGGSAIDVAKAVAMVSYSGGSARDYILGIRRGSGALPLIAIPTTHGTGTEVNRFSVLTEPELKAKLAIVSDYIYPKISVVDPELTLSLPSTVSSATVFDAFSHALEALFAARSNVLSRLFALEALRSIASEIDKLPEGYSNIDVRTKLLWASTCAGYAIDQSRTGLLHAIEHSISAFYPNIHHGVGLALIATAWARYTAPAVREKVKEVLRIFNWSVGDDVTRSFVEFMEYIKKKLGLHKRLSDFKVSRDDVKLLAEYTVKFMSVLIKNAPRSADKQAIEEILMDSL
ncbi:MAG: iron-containing alcohol dehydrogenase [Desulfurococcales archaeon]|nr:iron-containing alcohol dehydrogenase [Desulfurococcales archaeon]